MVGVVATTKVFETPRSFAPPSVLPDISRRKAHPPSKITRKHSTNRLTITLPSLIFNHMVELRATQMDQVFHALGDATRRRMLKELSGGGRTVSQLAEPFAMSLAAASKHIKVLESAGLIRREVMGRTHLCHLDPGPLATAHEWLGTYERFWTGRLDILERLLREDDARKAGNAKTESVEKKKEDEK